MFPNINSSKLLCQTNTIYQSNSSASSEKCFSTLLHIFWSSLFLSGCNQLCKAWRFLTLPISISHSTSPLPLCFFFLSLSLSSVLVQISNINQGRLRSSWSAVASLICPLLSAWGVPCSWSYMFNKHLEFQMWFVFPSITLLFTLFLCMSIF